MSPRIGDRYHLNQAGTLWVAPGREPLAPYVEPFPGRENLVRGEYRPNDDLYAGLLPGWTVYDLEPMYPGTSEMFTFTAGATYENKLFWGKMNMKSPPGVTFRNCAFAGPDPSLGLPSTSQGIFKCFGTGFYQWTAEDCLIDPEMWMDPALVRKNNAPPTDLETWRQNTRRNVAIHGGRCTLRRVQIKNCVDSMACVAKYQAGTFILVEDCWFHKAAYYRNYAVMPTLAEGTHSDIIQPALGRNMTFRGNYFGGPRDNTGYGPNYANGGSGIVNGDTSIGWNSGDDAWNNCIYLAQETASDWQTDGLLDNILFEQNFFEGSKYMINAHYETTRPNPFTNVSIRDNFFVRKVDNRYVTRSPQYAGIFSNNRIIDLGPDGTWTVGAEINYTNG